MMFCDLRIGLPILKDSGELLFIYYKNEKARGLSVPRDIAAVDPKRRP